MTSSKYPTKNLLWSSRNSIRKLILQVQKFMTFVLRWFAFVWLFQFHLLVAIALIIFYLQDYTGTAIFHLWFQLFQKVLQGLHPTFKKNFLESLLLSATNLASMKFTPIQSEFCTLNQLKCLHVCLFCYYLSGFFPLGDKHGSLFPQNDMGSLQLQAATLSPCHSIKAGLVSF